MDISQELMSVINDAIEYAREKEYEYVTPETILYALCDNDLFIRTFEACGGKTDILKKDLEGYFERYIEKKSMALPSFSVSTNQIIAYAGQSALSSGNEEIEIRHIIRAIFHLQESYAVYFLKKQKVNETNKNVGMMDFSDTTNTDTNKNQNEKFPSEKLSEQNGGIEIDTSFFDTDGYNKADDWD